MAQKATVFAYTAPLEKQLKEISKHIKERKIQRRIHRVSGNVIKKEMVKNIKDADEVIRVRRGHTTRSKTYGKPYKYDVPVGTLRRSVKVWLISKNQNAYWVGPKAGRKAPPHLDGWFAAIVEGGDQQFGNSTKNKDVFYKSIISAAPKALERMKKQYAKEIERKANATTKK